MTASQAGSARYRFGDSSRAGVVLGLSLRQSLPLIAGMLWLTLALMVQSPLLGLVGPVVGCVVAFGRWRRAPLYDVAVPGIRLLANRRRKRLTWTRGDLLGAGPGFSNDLPAALQGLEVLDVSVVWPNGARQVAVVRDRRAGTVSMVLHVGGQGFPVASLREQDGLVTAWGSALAPLARARCAVSRVTWQEWSHPVGVAGHREFLDSLNHRNKTTAAADYEELLVSQSPFTISHQVLLTVTVDLKRVPNRRKVGQLAAGIDLLGDEVRLLQTRLESAGLAVHAILSAAELPSAVRLRSDPSRALQMGTIRRSLAAAVGRGVLEWGPMAVEADWFHTRVDNSVHRSYRIAGWPMLPATADWLGPLLALPFPIARRKTPEEFERRYVESSIAAHGGNVSAAARASGLALRYFRLVKARQSG